MFSSSPVLTALMGSWAFVTAALVVVLIYRTTLSSREDDQIFIDAAEQHHMADQLEVIAKMTNLRAPIITLSVLSGVLLLAGGGLWVYRGLFGA